MTTSVAVDVVVLTVGEDGALCCLLVDRGRPPFAGCPALPGVTVADREDLDDAASRALRDRAGLTQLRHVEQLATFGAPDRDPRGRVVSVSYLGLTPRPTPVAEGARWHTVDGALAAPLAFDHREVLLAGRTRLRSKLGYSNVAFGLLSDLFTLGDLQRVYEAVIGRRLDKRNFRKKVLGLGLLAETTQERRGPHRPARLYRFADDDLVVVDVATIA